jgi:3-oxoacyl-[acyl-carrier-protein] synthase II
MAESPPIVVTGVGAVSGYGWGAAALWQGLRSGRTAVGPFDRFDHQGHRTHVAAQAPAENGAAADDHHHMASLADLFALAAAREALAQAGLAAAGAGLAPGLRAALFFGSSTGGIFESESFFDELTRDAARRRARLDLLRSQQTSGPGEAVARALGVGGPVLTISSACASATLAIGRGLEALRSGEVDVALVGGADSLCRMTYAGFNSLRAVDSEPCRPFRGERAGLSIGEGAALLVLEPLPAARARGARPLAWLAGAAASCDAYHMTAPDPSGGGVARAIRGALVDAGVEPAAVDFVNAHGTGTPLNDAAEWQALRAVFGERAARLPVTSTKGCVGHLLGSAGAIEAVATVLCLLHGEVHPTPGAGPVDPACPVDLVLGEGRPVAVTGAALSANFAFGGSNAALLLRSAAALEAERAPAEPLRAAS